MIDSKHNKPRAHGSTLLLENLLLSLAVPTPGTPSSAPKISSPIVLPNCTMHNTGNGALMCLFALQMLLDPVGTEMPVIKKGRIGRPGPPISPPVMSGSMGAMGTPSMSPVLGGGSGAHTFMGYATASPVSRPMSSRDLAGEFGQMQLRRSGSGSGPYLGTGGRRDSTTRRFSGLPPNFSANGRKG